MEYIAFDAHQRYTQVSVETVEGERRYEGRIAHGRGALQQFLTTCERGSPVAVETVGTWDWIVDEIEAAGQVPQLVHARQAKLVLGRVNQTDKLDARGLNRLQRTGTLPTVWIPPGALRDQRDLPRTRRVLTRERTRLKNRIHATLAKDRVAVGRDERSLWPPRPPVAPGGAAPPGSRGQGGYPGAPRRLRADLPRAQAQARRSRLPAYPALPPGPHRGRAGLAPSPPHHCPDAPALY